jgi:DNA-binding SARP family transcriptional activator/TolB-like protein/Flp pilus assembly protein TadD
MSQAAHHVAPAFAGQGAAFPLAVCKQPKEPLLRIHLIGEMRATTFLGDNVLPRGKKAQAILGCLCLAAGKPLRRAALAAMLWDRVPPDQARASFRQAFRELTVPLGELADEILEADRETIRLDADLCWIDALAVTAPAQRAIRSELAGHCKGELLARLDDASTSFGQWVVEERARFVETLRSLLEREAEQDAAESPARQRADIARRLIEVSPTYEGAWRVLMRALTDMKRPAEALEQYACCERTLLAQLGVKPSVETRALYEAIRASLRAEQGVINFVHIPPRHAAALAQPVPAGRSRLRVGVLPFRASTSLAGDDATLLSHEVVTELQRFRWFDVISLARGEHSGAPQNGDLIHRNGLDFVIDGALSGARSVQRVDVRMLDMTQHAAAVWNDRIDLGEAYRVDEVTARIVARIDPVIVFIQPKQREGQGATALLRRAVPLMYSMNRQKYEEAGRLLTRAVEEDPGNAKAAAWGAYWQVFHVGQGWATDPAQAFAIAERLARTAVENDPQDAEALGIYGHICSFLNKDFAQAQRYFERSLRLNPNLGHVWALSAVTRCYLGEPDAALARMDRYRDLAPYDPFFSFFGGVYALAYLIKHDYERAAAVGRRMVDDHPAFSNAYKPLIAALGYLGLAAEAKRYVELLLGLEPHFTVAYFAKVYPFARDVDRQHYLEGLRLAGVPEA